MNCVIFTVYFLSSCLFNIIFIYTQYLHLLSMIQNIYVLYQRYGICNIYKFGSVSPCPWHTTFMYVIHDLQNIYVCHPAIPTQYLWLDHVSDFMFFLSHYIKFRLIKWSCENISLLVTVTTRNLWLQPPGLQCPAQWPSGVAGKR